MNIVETKAFKPDSERWTPRIIGDGGYCSPACGGHTSGQCTVVKFNAAVELAESLAERMGEGWKPVVWENLGWHYKVTKSMCNIYPHNDDGFWIDINLPIIGQIEKTVKDLSEYAEFIAEIKHTVTTAMDFLQPGDI